MTQLVGPTYSETASSR